MLLLVSPCDLRSGGRVSIKLVRCYPWRGSFLRRKTIRTQIGSLSSDRDSQCDAVSSDNGVSGGPMHLSIYRDCNRGSHKSKRITQNAAQSNYSEFKNSRIPDRPTPNSQEKQIPNSRINSVNPPSQPDRGSSPNIGPCVFFGLFPFSQVFRCWYTREM